MNIALNLLQLAPGRPEGVATYVRQLATELDRVQTEDKFLLIVQPGLELPSFKRSVKVITFSPRSHSSPPMRVIRKAARLAGISIGSSIEGVIARNKIDVIHYPFSTIPEQDRSLKTTIVLSVMDLQHEYYPNLFSQVDLATRREAFGASADRAEQIIAISKYTKSSLVDKLKIDGSKIDVVYLDGNLSAKPDLSLQLPADFMFYPAADWPHKNHLALFQAMKLLKHKNGLCPNLILTGVTTERLGSLMKSAQDLGVGEEVVHLKQVSYDQVAGIYSKARMLVYPSLFEGFGIPVLEAMRAGVPVTCSNTTSLPEVAGKAAEFFNPTDVHSIAGAIEKVWTDTDYSLGLIKAGKDQAALFSWERCARETMAVYTKAYGKNEVR